MSINRIELSAAWTAAVTLDQFKATSKFKILLNFFNSPGSRSSQIPRSNGIAVQKAEDTGIYSTRKYLIDKCTLHSLDSLSATHQSCVHSLPRSVAPVNSTQISSCIIFGALSLPSKLRLQKNYSVITNHGSGSHELSDPRHLPCASIMLVLYHRNICI